MKTIRVLVDKYETIDGCVFDNKLAAEKHEGFLNGTHKKCIHCGGTGTVDPYGDRRSFIDCPHCDGKGYVTKQEVWK